MKKTLLSIIAIATTFSIFLCTGCKKSSADDTTTATTTTVLAASINNVSWTPDTLSANINYNAAAKTKTFSFVGTYSQKRLNGAVTLTNSTNTNTFTAGPYPIDATGNIIMLYSVQQKDINGNYVFVPYVAATSGDGAINITSINTTNNTVTGTFYFTHRVSNYDSNGNIISVSNNVVSGGQFTDMPYTFTGN